jgi:signal transduction histidine kinase
VGAGWWIAGRFLSPLQRITGTARRLSDRTLHERIDLQGPQDELKELADTFDGMLERLEVAFESQRRFIANVSHELRTPLTAQQALVEVVLADTSATAGELRSALEGVHAAALDQQRIVQGLLTLAISERALERRDLVDMASLARIAIDQVGNEVAHRGLTVEASLQRSRVLGDPTLLQRMVGNLLENAVRHNRSGGWIRVESSEADGHVRIVVTNTGDEVPATIAPLLIEPFTRLAGQRTRSEEGLGLGLSIVRAVSTAHGGRLGIESCPGGGLRVTLRFPAMARTQRDPGCPTLNDGW